MILTAAIVVVLFLAVVASLLVFAQHGPALWAQSLERAHERRSVKRFAPVVMSRSAPVPDATENERSHCSYAVEQAGNDAEQEAGTAFRSVVAYLEQCDDDLLLDILAQLTKPNGEWRFVESRIAKFIPGRDEDRVEQVREARGVEPPEQLMAMQDGGPPASSRLWGVREEVKR